MYGVAFLAAEALTQLPQPTPHAGFKYAAVHAPQIVPESIVASSTHTGGMGGYVWIGDVFHLLG